MDDYQKLREALLGINHEVIALIDQSETVLGGSTATYIQWRTTCQALARHLLDHVVRIGVVGAIKSGKSTLVNALLQGDYLKRGAGVVTSIVTRIRKGDQLGARLYFKSWDEINAEIDRALVLFPSDQWQSAQEHFDIRRQKDRDDLSAALEALDTELRVSQDQLNADGVLLAAYLKGYDQVRDLVGPESRIREFDTERFAEHRAFVGNDALAVFLKDIELRIVGEAVAGNMEIADCQGSDSPNPLHMAMIQDYLLKAHMIVYVISSRTGVRQADIRFLSMIKQMGIADTVLFVCNCDLNEHDSLDDMKALIGRIREEIGLIMPDPELFSFSALFHLFDECESDLAQRDGDRLKAWRQATDLVVFSNREIARLNETLHRKLTRERSSLLLKNQLERLDVTLTGLRQWLQLNRELLNRDAGEAKKLADHIRTHQGRMSQVETMIQSTLAGAVQKKKNEVRKQVDRLFDSHSGPLLEKIITFVRNYSVDVNNYQQSLTNAGFTQTLYFVFQGFKQAVDSFMAEKINPEIIRFTNQTERELKEYFKYVAEPYEAMVRNALSQYEETLTNFGIAAVGENWDLDPTPDLEIIKQAIGLSLPPAAATMRYSAQIKTEAVARLGFYSLIQVFRKMLKKPTGGENERKIKALHDGVRRMRRETERSILAHFKDYQENIKFQYMLRLTDAAGERLYESLIGNFRGYQADLNALIDTIGSQRSDKKQLDDALGAVGDTIDALRTKIGGLRGSIAQLHSSESTNREPVQPA